jgi:hypothetical protein
MDLMAVVFWTFIALAFALIVGVFVYVRWSQPGWGSPRGRVREPTFAEVRATKVRGSVAAIFKLVAVVCGLLGLVVLGWLATLE